jgi:hypothetical protein
MARLVVSQSAHSQKTNPKLNLLSEKENDIRNFCCTYLHSWKNELGSYLLSSTSLDGQSTKCKTRQNLELEKKISTKLCL